LVEGSSTGAIVGAAAADPVASAVAGLSAEAARTGIGACDIISSDLGCAFATVPMLDMEAAEEAGDLALAEAEVG
jgi:hypothetical protein